MLTFTPSLGGGSTGKTCLITISIQVKRGQNGHYGVGEEEELLSQTVTLRVLGRRMMLSLMNSPQVQGWRDRAAGEDLSNCREPYRARWLPTLKYTHSCQGGHCSTRLPSIAMQYIYIMDLFMVYQTHFNVTSDHQPKIPNHLNYLVPDWLSASIIL